MNEILASLTTAISQHPERTIAVVVGYIIFQNFTLTMPPPDANSGKGYKWAFGFLHGLALLGPRFASNFFAPGSLPYKLIAGGNGGEVNGTPPPPAPTAPAPPQP